MRRRAAAAIAFTALVATSCAGPQASPGSGAPSVTGSAPASPAQATSSPSALTQPSPSAAGPATRVALTGQGPIGLDLAGDRAWVVLPDSGDLAEVDLASATEVRSIAVGTGGSHVAVGSRAIYVGRFDASGGGETLVVVEPTTGEVSGISVGPLESVSVDGETVWALEKTGTIQIIDAKTRAITGSTSVHIDPDAHAEAVPGAGSLWISGDRTPVHRIDPKTAKVVADIETGGGIPLAFSDGLIWGARADELWAIDPASDEVSRRVPLANLIEILALDVDGDEAWLAVRHPGRVGAVVRLDVATEQVVAEFSVSLPAGVAIDASHVWVTSYDTNELLGFERGPR